MTAFRCSLFFAMALEVASNTCPAIPTTPKMCSEKRAGYCTLNADSSTDVKCPAGKELIHGASDITGNTETKCCRELTCFGNSVESNNIVCGDKKMKKTPDPKKRTADECCEDKKGFCTGNADAAGDHKCGAGLEYLPTASTTQAADDMMCCGKKCSVYTAAGGGQECKATDGVEIKAAKANDVVSDFEKQTCCTSIPCCGGSSAVDCGADKMFKWNAKNTARGDDAGKVARCCIDIKKGQCSGNTDSSTDVDCGDKILVADATKKGTDVATCCQDTCKSKVTTACPAGKHNIGPFTLGGLELNEANCCTEDVKDKCYGNTDSSTDFTCADKTEYNPAAANENIKDKTDAQKQTACCRDKTKYCSGNKVASEDVDCSTCHGTNCKAKTGPGGIVPKWTNEKNKCSVCCETTPDNTPAEGTSDTAREAAVLSSVALAIMCAIRFV